jgi:phosphatidylglycerol:prolipoprotein diacylglycerol transferase
MDGGLVLAVLCGLAFLLLTKQPVLTTLDALSPSFALGIVLTRIGCFLNGCCYGRPYSGPLSVVFPQDSPAGWIYSLTPLHPAQLYNSLGGLVMLGLLLWLERHKSFPGFTFFLALIFYGLLRLLGDFFRYFEEDVIVARLGKLPFTVNQGISLVVMMLALVFFLRFHFRRAALEKEQLPGSQRS